MSWLLDFKYVVRVIFKRPGFTIFTMLIMALGLGLSVYMYSLINTLVLKPLPFVDGERMVIVSPVFNNIRLGEDPLNYLDYKNIVEKSRELEDIGFYYGEVANVSLNGKAIRYMGVRADSNLFEFTNTGPFKGRIFDENDIGEGANPVVIIGYQLWKNELGGRDDVIGKEININGTNTEIIGVMPKSYEFPFNNQIWLSTQINDSKVSRTNNPEVFVFAKLAKGTSIDKANDEIAEIMKSLAIKYPTTNTGRSAYVLTFKDSFMGEDSKPMFIIMLVGVAFILLLSCCNVGNLLLARATERAKESCIRIAHGAPTFRLILQMMMESLIICILGGLLGLLLAGWGLELTNQVIAFIVPDKPPFWLQLGLDLDVILKSIFLVFVVTIITGFFPSLRMTKYHVMDVLRDGTRGAQSKKGGRLTRILVIFEVFLSCVILSLSVLLSSIVNEAQKVDYGINPNGIYMAKVSLPERYNNDKIISFYNSLENILMSELPNTKVGIMTSLPGEFRLMNKIILEGQAVLSTEQNLLPRAYEIQLLPGSLKMMDVELKTGRLLNKSDNETGQKVVVVSDTFVKKNWPNEKQVLGKKIRPVDSDDWYTVVGVISHVIQGRPFGISKSTPSVYYSIFQRPNRQFSIITHNIHKVNTRFNIEKAVNTLDLNTSIYQAKTLNQVLERNIAGLSYTSTLFNLFGFISILLAGSGIYAVMTKVISLKHQELSVRRAMGATGVNIFLMLMRESSIQLIIGLVLAAPIVYVVSTFIINILGFQVLPIILLFGAVSLGILTIVFIATLIPARKSIKQNPADALRE